MSETRVRSSIIGVVVLALFSALFARLWFLQVAATAQFARYEAVFAHVAASFTVASGGTQ